MINPQQQEVMAVEATAHPLCKELEFMAEANLAKSLADYPDKQFYGFFCSYFPEELALAAGLEPVRIFPPPGDVNPPELPAFCCSLARGSLALATKGGLAGLRGVGFAHTCDTMQCLSGIWAERLDKDSTIIMVPPVMLAAAGAKEYLEAELTNVLQRLYSLSGKIPAPDDLSGAVELCREIRSLAKELGVLSTGVPGQLMANILRAGQVLPRQIYRDALREVIPYLQANYIQPAGPKILLTGAVLENDSIFRMIEELGGRVVVDDTCTGLRHYHGSEGSFATPMEAIASRLLHMPPCPCRQQGLNTRLQYLSESAERAGVQGVIITIRKFCEPHAWDAVPLSQYLRDKGLRTLVLELDGAEMGGPERTRLQAFLESI